MLALGDEEAASLGVRPGRVRVAVIAAATLMTAAAVSISGIIGLDRSAGAARRAPARRAGLPAVSRRVSLVLGAGFMLAVDTLARTAARIEIPLGVLTAFVGTPIFLWLLATSRRSWQ